MIDCKSAVALTFAAVAQPLPPAEQDADGLTLAHLVWMGEQITTGVVEGRKAHRWLGYIQGCLCSSGLAHLHEMKEASREASFQESEDIQTQEPILQFFAWAHLPEHLQDISRPFGEAAFWMVATLPRNPERTVALRKLLEAKDAAVRARLYK